LTLCVCAGLSSPRKLSAQGLVNQVSVLGRTMPVLPCRVLEWLQTFASERGLQYQQDKVGNIVIKRPGSGGGEQAPHVVIQGHVDMVCEKNASVDHDFHADPLRLLREGDWVKADGTTLGSDNGERELVPQVWGNVPHAGLC